MTVVIAGGGTAGHVYPALALARALEGDDVVFAGTSRGAEATLVPSAGFDLEVIDVRGFDRARPFSIFAVGVRALRASGQARSLIRRRGAQVVVGMGGYVSLPACVAARRLGVPIVLHEQNIVLGLANRVSKPLARSIGVSFGETLQGTGRKGVLVGNPVRPEIVSFDRDADRRRGIEQFGLDPERATLLVFGGSQGARRVNDAALGLASLWAERDDVQILHLAGRVQAQAFVDGARERIAGAGLHYRVVDYTEDMAAAYAVADLALCRGGATTVAELCVVGLPSIIVPYPHHRDRQQERHGRALERDGAATVVLDSDATPERIAELAGEMLADERRLEEMRAAALAIARPEAATELAKLVRKTSA